MAVTNEAGHKTSLEHLQDVFDRLGDPTLYDNIRCSNERDVSPIFYNFKTKKLTHWNKFGDTIFVVDFDYKKFRDAYLYRSKNEWNDVIMPAIARRIKRQAKRLLTNIRIWNPGNWQGDKLSKHNSGQALAGYIVPEDIDNIDAMRINMKARLTMFSNHVAKKSWLDAMANDHARTEWGLDQLLEDGIKDAHESFGEFTGNEKVRRQSHLEKLILMSTFERYDLIADAMLSRTKGYLEALKSGGREFELSCPAIDNILVTLDLVKLREHVSSERLEELINLCVMDDGGQAFGGVPTLYDHLPKWLNLLGAKDIYYVPSNLTHAKIGKTDLPRYYNPIRIVSDDIDFKVVFSRWEDLSKVVTTKVYRCQTPCADRPIRELLLLN